MTAIQKLGVARPATVIEPCVIDAYSRGIGEGQDADVRTGINEEGDRPRYVEAIHAYRCRHKRTVFVPEMSMDQA